MCAQELMQNSKCQLNYLVLVRLKLLFLFVLTVCKRTFGNARNIIQFSRIPSSLENKDLPAHCPIGPNLILNGDRSISHLFIVTYLVGHPPCNFAQIVATDKSFSEQNFESIGKRLRMLWIKDTNQTGVENKSTMKSIYSFVIIKSMA